MACTFDRELLALFAAGDSTEAERRQVELHLQGCAECEGIVAQHDALSEGLAGSLAGVSAVQRAPRRRWGALVAAVAAAFVLFGSLQIPAVKAQVARIYSFMTVFEMDEVETTELIGILNSIKDGQQPPVKVYRPEVFSSIAEAEEAWGGAFPQPIVLPHGLRLDHVGFFHFDDGEKRVELVYAKPEGGRHILVSIDTRKRNRRVPEGATSETVVGGQKAVVIRGSYTSFEGGPVTWTPKDEISLYFTLGELYVEVSTGAGATVEDLVQVAESLQ